MKKLSEQQDILYQRWIKLRHANVYRPDFSSIVSPILNPNTGRGDFLNLADDDVQSMFETLKELKKRLSPILRDVNFRVGMVLIPGSANPDQENFVRSGVRITSIAENGLMVERIHMAYLSDEPQESWLIKIEQIEDERWKPLPVGYQLPLF